MVCRFIIPNNNKSYRHLKINDNVDINNNNVNDNNNSNNNNNNNNNYPIPIIINCYNNFNPLNLLNLNLLNLNPLNYRLPLYPPPPTLNNFRPRFKAPPSYLLKCLSYPPYP